MVRKIASKIAQVAFFFAIGIFPHFVHATVLQGVSSSAGSNQSTQVGAQSQAFTGISDPLESVTVYASRKDTAGTASLKNFNILSVQCWEDAMLTLPCAESGLNGSGFVVWNYRNQTGFTTTSNTIPQTANQTIGENATITEPFDSKVEITIPIIATTTHVFEPSNYYNFAWTEVIQGADSVYFWGSGSDVYAQTDFVPATTTSPYIVDMYFKYNDENTGDTSLATTSTTQIEKNVQILEPTFATTTATTTFNVQVKFKTAFTFDYRPTTTRVIYITDALTEEIEWIATSTLEANASENITINTTATTSEGSKYIVAFYMDPNNDIYSEVDTVFFNVATNTFYQATGLLTPTTNPSDLTQINCDLYDVGCQFQKAITFLFVPPSNTLDKFSNLWQTISNKRPFGYVTVIMAQLNALSATGPQAFTLGTIPFMDSIFTPLRTLIAGILWGVFAVFFFRNHLAKLDI